MGLTFSGCSLMRAVLPFDVGPVDDKSQVYGVLDLAREDPDWVKLDPKAVAGDAPSKDAQKTQSTDIAFQSKNTGSIITLNSSCRDTLDSGGLIETADEVELRNLTRSLTMGFTDISLREEKQIQIQDLPALETTVVGQLPENPEKDPIKRVPMTLRAVVLRKGSCTYDLVYIARPKQFIKNEQSFTRFVNSLRFR